MGRGHATHRAMSQLLTYRGSMTVITAHEVARRERAMLCDAFDLLGPHAPTMCTGWTTRDLAAHLVVRESRPDAAPGIFVKALKPRLDAAMAAQTDKPWPELVAAVRNGPPKWSPLHYAEGLANLIEFVVHREDVMRAQGDTRVEDRNHETLQLIWKRLRISAPVMFRHDRVEVTCPGFGSWKTRGSSHDASVVTITGSPVDVLLLATGRPHTCEISAQSVALTAFEQRRRAI